jgi:fatty acid desaturase
MLHSTNNDRKDLAPQRVALSSRALEWPTICLYVLTVGLWLWATSGLYAFSPLAGIVLAGLAITQFSSLQHEALHGHPFTSPFWNEVLATPALSLTVPYRRFRDTHLAHHYDPNLTDPYDDPESNYLHPKVWARLPKPAQILLRVNNTLIGRVTLGPFLGNALWLRNEARMLAAGDKSVRQAWALHVLGLAPVVLWLWVASMPFWAYLCAAWIGHSILKIRTFLEHRAHEAARARTVIIEDRGPLSLLFLNNNFHSVHHAQPGVAWYRLPGIYLRNKSHFLARNEGYAYRSYAQVFRQYAFRAKDPVPHPLRPLQ